MSDFHAFRGFLLPNPDAPSAVAGVAARPVAAFVVSALRGPFFDIQLRWRVGVGRAGCWLKNKTLDDGRRSSMTSWRLCPVHARTEHRQISGAVFGARMRGHFRARARPASLDWLGAVGRA